MATLATYTTIVQNEVDDTSSGAVGIIQQYVKETYQEIIRRVGKYLIDPTIEDVTVSISDGTYTPTTNWMELIGVYYKSAGGTNFSELREISQAEYRDTYQNMTDGQPTYFVQEGLGIRIVPSPSDAGTLRTISIAVQAELTGVVTSIIPDRYEHVIKNGASYKYKAFDDNPAATEFERYYLKGLSEMEQELASRTVVKKPKLFGM